jgi:hypothetical protein
MIPSRPSILTAVDGRDSAALRRQGIVSPGDSVGGRYVVEEVLGKGGMGIVVAARHEALGHRVAMKLVSTSMAADADAFVRFSREARIIASLESDHVVRVIDFGMHAGTPYMVMELLAGRDLGCELRMRGALPVAEAVDHVIQACDGLSVAHAKGVVHRDVKLANLFLAMRADGERVVKVLDFGVSKLQVEAHDDVHLTRTTSMIGSPTYMAPEQIRDPRTVDARADVWSLGVVLYKLLTDDAPFVGLSANALCAAIAADPPTPLRTRAPHVPRRLQAVVLRCLEKRPEVRYASVAALARDLAPFASRQGQAAAHQLVARATAEGTLEPAAEDGARLDAVTAFGETDGASVLDPHERAPGRDRNAVRSRVATVASIVAMSAVAAVVAGRVRSGTAAASVDSPPAAVSAASLVPALEPDTQASASSALTAASPGPPLSGKGSPVPGAAGSATTTRLFMAPRKHVASSAHSPPPATPSAGPTAHFGGSALDDHH